MAVPNHQPFSYTQAKALAIYSELSEDEIKQIEVITQMLREITMDWVYGSGKKEYCLNGTMVPIEVVQILAGDDSKLINRREVEFPYTLMNEEVALYFSELDWPIKRVAKDRGWYWFIGQCNDQIAWRFVIP